MIPLGQPGAFRLDDLPKFPDKWRILVQEDWPLFIFKFVDHLGLTYVFVLLIHLDITKHLDAAEVSTLQAQEAEGMSAHAAHRERLEQAVYNHP